MADESLRSAMPVAMPGGLAGRQHGPQHGPAHGAPSKQPAGHEAPPSDSVRVHAAASVAPELVRERVLAYTRQGLELNDGETSPEFAEVRAGEPALVFLGRLLSAQNQLAARRAASWPVERLRQCLDEALRSGCREALEILSEEGHGAPSAVQFVVDVVAEYIRRLASLGDAADADRLL